MLNQAIGWVGTIALAGGSFLAALVLAVVVPEAFRRRWPVVVASVVAGAVVTIEVVTAEPS